MNRGIAIVMYNLLLVGSMRPKELGMVDLAQVKKSVYC